MAKFSTNAKDRELKNFRENPTTAGTTERYVVDESGNSLLQDIKDAIGGTSDTTATIYNVTIAVAATEQSQALPANCKGFIIKTRGKSKLQIAYAATSGSNFITVQPGATYKDTNFYSSLTLYFQSNKAGDIVEILAFS